MPGRSLAPAADALILSIALQLIQGAADGPPGGPGLVLPAGDLPGLVDDGARGRGRLFPHPGIGGQFLCRVAGDVAQEEGHGDRIYQGASIMIHRYCAGDPAPGKWAAAPRAGAGMP